ncbi:MAG: pantoate--beta-alanine ligase [Acidimicrobiales bacterium]
MRVLDRGDQLRKELDAARSRGRTVGLVPTMGFLHEGHASLIRRSARECDLTAVTVFVNPLQFNPTEDLDDYPADLDHDLAVATEAGADVLFAPPADEMYPGGVPRVTVHVAGVDVLEGASRPGHFDGVATVVAKLFNLAGPCHAYFGEKDWQQLEVVRRMVADLNFPVRVVACPTVREPDGLACSSRNARLSPAERKAATVLYRALSAAAASDDPRRVMAEVVAGEPLATLDYAEVVGDRLLIAARVGGVRLIDNMEVR